MGKREFPQYKLILTISKTVLPVLCDKGAVPIKLVIASYEMFSQLPTYCKVAVPSANAVLGGLLVNKDVTEYKCVCSHGCIC